MIAPASRAVPWPAVGWGKPADNAPRPA